MAIKTESGEIGTGDPKTDYIVDILKNEVATDQKNPMNPQAKEDIRKRIMAKVTRGVQGGGDNG